MKQGIIGQADTPNKRITDALVSQDALTGEADGDNEQAS